MHNRSRLFLFVIRVLLLCVDSCRLLVSVMVCVSAMLFLDADIPALTPPP